MKKWIIGSIAVFCVLLWLFIDLYSAAQADKTKDMQKFIQFAEEETGLAVEHVERFHGHALYYVFKARDEEDSAYFVFVNESFQLRQIAEEDIGLPREEAGSLALKDYPELTAVREITPAYTGGEFCWEVKAIDSEKNLHYLYYTMTAGEFHKRYTLGNEGK